MALPDVLTLVENRLPFLPTDGSCDVKISEFKLEQYYFLQPLFGFSDAIVEDDTTWTGLKRMLVADLVSYYLVVREVVKVTGGEGGTKPTGSKRIKKGKADVVEAEFDYAKAGDGSTIAMETKRLIDELKIGICSKSITLKIYLPGFCPPKKQSKTKPFIFFPNTNI